MLEKILKPGKEAHKNGAGDHRRGAEAQRHTAKRPMKTGRVDPCDAYLLARKKLGQIGPTVDGLKKFQG